MFLEKLEWGVVGKPTRYEKRQQARRGTSLSMTVKAPQFSFWELGYTRLELNRSVPTLLRESLPEEKSRVIERLFQLPPILASYTS